MWTIRVDATTMASLVLISLTCSWKQGTSNPTRFDPTDSRKTKCPQTSSAKDGTLPLDYKSPYYNLSSLILLTQVSRTDYSLQSRLPSSSLDLSVNVPCARRPDRPSGLGKVSGLRRRCRIAIRWPSAPNRNRDFRSPPSEP